ncbi:Filamentous hemagglutinin, partial [Folsomia candida]
MILSKAAQSIPGPSNVAGNTSQRVIAATITATPLTPRIKTEFFSPQPQGEQFEVYLSSDDEDEEEVEVEENKMKVADTLMQILRWVKIKEKSFKPNNTAAPISNERYPPSARVARNLQKLVVALEDVLDVLDDKRRRGFPLYEIRRAQRNKLWRAAAIWPEMMLDFVLDEERSTIPPATAKPTRQTLPVTPPATTMPRIMLDFVPVEEMSTIPPATPRPSTPPPLPVNPPATIRPEMMLDIVPVEEWSTIPPATPRPSAPPPPQPTNPSRAASSQFANRRKSSRTTRPILKLNVSTGPL